MLKSYNIGAVAFCLAVAVFSGCAPKSDTPAPTANEPDAAAAIVAQKAEAGVGKQGQLLAGHSDAQKIISGPAATLLNVKQKKILEWDVPKALQLYQALEGNFPKSHEEFMAKIVEANNLVLPELPEGAVYHFNTEKGELWVYPEGEVPQ